MNNRDLDKRNKNGFLLWSSVPKKLVELEVWKIQQEQLKKALN